MSKKLSETLICLNDTMTKKTTAMHKRIEKLETKSAPLKIIETKSLGERITESDQMKCFLNNNSKSGRFNFTQRDFKAAILGTGQQNDPLTQISREPIAPGATRRLFIRDLLLGGETNQAAVEYPIEETFTNNAGPQVGGSPEQYQNVALAESGLTFKLSFEPCVNIGHWLNTSKQILQDAGVLQTFLTQRMLFGSRLAEEREILNGTGLNGQLNGLLQNATAYAQQSPVLTDATQIIRRMLLQLETNDFYPSAIIMNPLDWYDIDVRKVGATDDRYIIGSPRELKEPSLWNTPVIVTNAIPVKTLLVGDFAIAAVLFDREQPYFEYVYNHDNNFVMNLVTLKVDQRISLVTTNPAGLIKATLA